MVGLRGEPGRESISGGVGKSEKGGDDTLEEEGGLSTLMEGGTRGFVTERVEEARLGPERDGSGIDASPALMPMDVWTHRKNGEEWMTI